MRVEGAKSAHQRDRRSWAHPTRLATLVIVGWVGAGLAVSGLVTTIAFEMPLLPSLIAIGAVAGLLAFKGVYRTRMVPAVSSMFSRVLTAVSLGVVVGLSVARVTSATAPTIGDTVALVAGLWLGAVGGLALSSTSLKRLWVRGKLRSRALVIGAGQLTHELILELRLRRSYGVSVEALAYLGTAPPSTGHPAETPLVPLSEIPSFCLLYTSDAADE